MTTITDIAEILDGQAKAVTEFKNAHTTRVNALEEQVKQIAMKAQRPNFGGSNPGSPNVAPAVWIDPRTKSRIDVLSADQSLLQREVAATEHKGDIPSMGRVLRGLALGGAADDARELEAERKALNIGNDPQGGYSVQGMLSSAWIDKLRAAMVLTRAGAQTVPMDAGELLMLKLTGDPTVSWHAENGSVPDTDATFGQVRLAAKTCVALVKLSIELAQDSSNIEAILERALIQALANAIDSAGLVGVTTNAAVAPMTGAGVLNLSGRNTVTSIGTPVAWDFAIDGMYELLADNVPMANIGALVANPVLWKHMAKLKTGLADDNTPLMPPSEVSSMPKLWTTAAPTGTAMIADWRDLMFGVRKNITIDVLRQTFLGSNLQIGILAHARVDFAAVRSESFCSLEDITYA
ncbi:MAG: phage major capsid protein [Burkholderiaceae bacterium]|nr:phage major capsid protein [Rhodoferax sp.]MCP5284201.1 phage major capsid protein [Burkholderiaceae bacterium]